MKKTLAAAVLFFFLLEAASALSPAPLTGEEVLNRALLDAGVSADQVTIHEVEKEQDHGETFYELQFSDPQNHYFYALRGDGRILKKSIEKKHVTSAAEPSDSYISESEAQSISLKVVGWPPSGPYLKSWRGMKSMGS